MQRLLLLGKRVMSNEFRAAIKSAGLNPPEHIEPGKIHRFPGIRKCSSNRAGWCKLFHDGKRGVFGDWATGLTEFWQARRDQAMTPAERQAFWRCIEEARAEAEQERVTRQNEAATKAADIWQSASAVTDHPYLSAKDVKAHGIREFEGDLIIPVRDGGRLYSLQFIDANGGKRFLSGGRIQGCYYAIGKPDSALCIAEGFATAASIHEATGHAVAVAFNAQNIEQVAKALRIKFPDVRLIVCADNDGSGIGQNKAQIAANAVGADVAIAPDTGDWNDYAIAHGHDAVREGINVAKHSTGAEPADNWPAPLPITQDIPSEPYPLDALPDNIRGAIAEVQGFVQAPVAIVASVAVATVALAVQSYIDVERDTRLAGPVGLYFLVLAQSGERKTSVEKFFLSAIREYQKECREEAQPLVDAFEANKKAWEAKKAGIQESIRNRAKNGKSTSEDEAALRELESDKPVPPKVPRLVYEDVTPEELGHSLATRWPCGGVFSAEAGNVLGAHGMGRDSVMRNLSTYNLLWDGVTKSVDRRKEGGSFVVEGARLSMCLQVQLETIHVFAEKNGTLARGIGFFARFLMAWPPSTQGTRLYKEPPRHWPALANFHKRIRSILEQEPAMDGNALTPETTQLTGKAKQAWITFHDSIEAELADTGELADVRDVAAKAADNVARLAAVFAYFESSPITASTIEAAGRIVAWHLNEARRVMSDLNTRPDVLDSHKLDKWLLAYCRQHKTATIKRRQVQQYGPLRDSSRLTTALRALEELGRVFLHVEGRQKIIAINPELFPTRE